MHLIILKWLRRQKCRQKGKTMKQEDVEAKEEILYESVFIYLNKKWKCSLFSLQISLQTCSKSLKVH